MRRERWQRRELLAAFALYCRTPFGMLHAKNPDIIDLARLLNRTPGAAAMKLCNFASLDPVQRARGVRGLANTSKADEDLWEELADNPTLLALASEEALAEVGHPSAELPAHDVDMEVEAKETEATAERSVRLVQRFFREAVLTSYDRICAVCEIPVVDLLNASHIIPWSVDAARRADPRNGIALCTLHDRAFDRGLMTVDEDLRTVVSMRLRSESELPILNVAFAHAHGRQIHRPHRFEPAPEALEYHRRHIFQE